MRLYIDMDGTSTDFEDQFIRYVGISPSDFMRRTYAINQRYIKPHLNPGTEEHIRDISEQLFWRTINGIEKFWETMPYIHGFEKVWSIVKWYNPSFLTSVPIFEFVRNKVIYGKRKWINKHVGNHIDMYITFFDEDHKNTHKEMFCKDETDILIDNMKENVDTWKSYGGTGIFFENSEQTISEFYDIVKKNNFISPPSLFDKVNTTAKKFLTTKKNCNIYCGITENQKQYLKNGIIPGLLL